MIVALTGTESGLSAHSLPRRFDEIRVSSSFWTESDSEEDRGASPRAPPFLVRAGFAGYGETGSGLFLPGAGGQGASGVADDGGDEGEEHQGEDGGRAACSQAEDGKDRIQGHSTEAAVKGGLVG